MDAFPAWTWNIPDRFNIGAACTDAHLGTAVESRIAVVVDNAELGERQLTFGQIAGQTSRFAQLLRELDVLAGERVLIRLPNCIEYPVIFLGAIKRGAVPVPTSILLTADEFIYLAQDSGASVIVTDRPSWNILHQTIEAMPQVRHVVLAGGGDTAPASRVRVLDFDAALAGISQWEAPHPTGANDPAYLVYTSGTTGYAKGVLHAQRALLGRQPSSDYWFDFQPQGERVLHSGKFNWTYVLGTGMMDPLYRGHTAIVHEGPPDPAVWPQLIARHAATVFIGVPTLYRQIIQKTAYGKADVPTLRHCMCAGEHLSDEVLAAWHERFGIAIYEGLGMTECSYYICQTRSRPIRPGSAGFIQPGHAVKLLDPATWQEVPDGAEGMLCIPRSDPGLMLGYWNKPAETALCYHEDWFLTGDYARRDADGYIWFLGRRDDLIKSFGYRVSPHEVERVLKDHPDIADAAVVGEEIEPGKLLIAAYVVARTGADLTADDVIAHGRRHLASYKAPRVAYLVNELPRTRNGKVLRRALKPAIATNHDHLGTKT